MIKKIVLSALGIAVVAALVTPTFIGQSAERDIKSLVEAIDKHPVYGAELKSYQRNWFTSHAVLAFTSKLPEAEEITGDRATTLHSGEVTLDLQHGPVLTRYDAGLGTLSWQLTANDQSLRDTLTGDADKPLYQAIGSVGLTGRGVFRDEIADVSYQDKTQNFTFQISGLQGEGAFSKEGLRYQGASEQLTFGIENEPVLLNNVAFTTEVKGTLIDALTGGLVENDNLVTVEKIGSNSDALMEGIKIRVLTELSEDGETMGVDVEQSIASVEVLSQVVKDLKLKLSVDQIDSDFIKAYYQFGVATNGETPEFRHEQMVALFEKHLDQLVAAKPQLSITELSGKLPDGDFNGKANVVLDEIDTLPSDGVSAEFLQDHLLGEGAIQVDKSLVESIVGLQLRSVLARQMPHMDVESDQFKSRVDQQVTQLISFYLQNGYLVDKNTEYESILEFREGGFLLNGNSIPLI
ncbi:MAG: DUF945 family protein [Pseudomonadota bacterium]